VKRLFLACTPRTGNVWFRKLLASCLGITEIAAHSPAEIDWDALPAECLAAMHWHRTPELAALLEGHQILVTTRHPLDVLVSILHFSQHEPATARWLDGEGGNEEFLAGARPTDERFLEYAFSDRAAALLSVSVEWSQTATAIVSYEELVKEPRKVLERVLSRLGEPVPANLDELIEAHRIENLRALSAHHFWRGRPGLWRELITEEYSQAIYHRHRDAFLTFGYTIDGDPAPPAGEAHQNWTRLLSE
jgi:hypothetical protein